MTLQQFPHRVTIEQKAKEPIKNDFGELDDQWQPVLLSIYANVINQTGRETTNSEQTQNFIGVSVRIRYRPSVNDDMRVVHAGRKLRILAVLPDPTRRYLDIKCEAWTDAK